MMRRLRLLASATAALGFAACSPELLDSPAPEPAGPHPELAPYALALDVDVATARVRPVAAVPGGAAHDGLAYSLLGNTEVLPTISNITRGPAVNGRVAFRFDVALTSLLNSGNLVTPTFPIPPSGVQGLLLIPFQIRDKQGPGTVREGPEWDGAPTNFFNDFNCTATSGGNDCYPYEPFPAPLGPLASTAARTVGFDIDSRVRSFTVLMILAADISNTPPPPPPSGAIAGRVTSAAAGALRGVTVTAGGQPPATTDLAGAYQFTGVPVGETTVQLGNLPSGCTAPPSQTAMVLAGGLATIDFSVTCPAPPATTGTVAGTVTSPTLGNLYGVVAVVNPGNRGGATDGAGSYAVPGVPAGAVTVTLSNLPAGCVNPGAQAATVVEGASVPVNFSVNCGGTDPGSGTGSVTGTLHGTGGALAEVVVTLQPGNLTATTDPNGVFTFRDLTPGTGLLTFGHLPIGCGNPGSQAVEIIGGRGAVVNLQVTCAPLGTIRGRVVDLDGAPVAGASVTADGDGEDLGDTTDDAGNYNIGGLTPGTYTVRAVRTRCASPSPSVVVDPFRTTTVSITADCPASLLVNVTMLPAPIPGLTMHLVSPLGAEAATSSIPPTRFRLPTPGVWTISFTGQPQGCTVSGPTSFEAAQQRDFTPDLTITCAAGQVSGLISDRDGRPVPLATVRFSKGTAVESVVTDAGGHYLSPGLESGVWYAGVEKPGACLRSMAVPVLVTGGQGLGFSFEIDCPPVVSGTVTRTGTPDSVLVELRPSSGPKVTVEVTGSTYTSTLSAGTWSATLGIPSNCTTGGSRTLQLAQQSRLTVDFSVTCTAATGMVITPVNYDYGDVVVGKSGTDLFAVTNHSTGPVVATSLELLGPADYSISSTTCPGALALAAPPGGQCIFALSFAPGATGNRLANMVIHFSSGAAITLTLDGTGVTGEARLASTPHYHDFGFVPVGTSAYLHLTLTNTGTLPASDPVLGVRNANIDEFMPVDEPGTPPSTCSAPSGLNLVPGQSCTLTIRFTPQGAGTRSASFFVQGTGNQGDLVTIPLSGTGF